MELIECIPGRALTKQEERALIIKALGQMSLIELAKQSGFSERYIINLLKLGLEVKKDG